MKFLADKKSLYFGIGNPMASLFLSKINYAYLRFKNLSKALLDKLVGLFNIA